MCLIIRIMPIQGCEYLEILTRFDPQPAKELNEGAKLRNEQNRGCLFFVLKVISLELGRERERRERADRQAEPRSCVKEEVDILSSRPL